MSAYGMSISPTIERSKCNMSPFKPFRPKPYRLMRFSERETCRLVELYQQHECLWNVRNANYRNRQMKHAACQAIAREMNIEDFRTVDVKVKLKNLRGTYNQELIKIERLAKAGNTDYTTNMKWFYIMDSFLKRRKNGQPPGDNLSLENGEHAYGDIFPDDSQCEQQSGDNLDNESVSFSSAQSMPAQSEMEQSIKSISDPEVITVTPEIQPVQYILNTEAYSAKPDVQNNQSDSHSQVVTVTPEILSVKAVSEPEFTPLITTVKTLNTASSPESVTVTSRVEPTIKSVSNSEMTGAPSGIQTVKSSTTPKVYALVPDRPISNSRFVSVMAGKNQNVRFVPYQEKDKQVSTDETQLSPREWRLEENSSSDSKTESRQINNTRTINDRSEDEMDAFGHFVALNLRKMSMKMALSAQTEVLSVLTRYRLKDSSEKLPSKQTLPCIVTNGSSANQNPLVLQKFILQS